jgi:hypothetical protein
MPGDFKVKFDIYDYRDIFPPQFVRDYCKHDEVINERDLDKGNIDKCIWTRHIPTKEEIASPWWVERECTRILRTGVIIGIKNEPMWIPPNYYFALQYGRGGSSDLQFRIKRLKNVYFKIRARLNEGCLGTLVIKNRGDGETTMAVTDGFHQCLDGMLDIGQVGIQSKTRDDGKNPCWSYVQTLWQSLPQWLKSKLCSDFVDGNKMAENIKFMRDANEELNIKARNVLYAYYPSGTPMDGKHDMRRCILDEVCKWVESKPFYPVFINYMKFIMPGGERRGLFDMFSSPADSDCESNKQAKMLWDNSNMDEIVPETGTTKSRIHRWHSDPLEGIPGFYDKWGDADPDLIYAHIMTERKSKPKELLLEEIRGYPLNEEEMWGSHEGGETWANSQGIKDRRIYLLGTRFKNDITKEPARLYGNLEWEGGVRDSEVGFRQADTDKFDVIKARFAITGYPQNRIALKTGANGALLPPAYVGGSLGIDPIDKRYITPGARGFSNAGMVNWVFRDLFETGINKMPTLIYSCRPSHAEIFFEDAIKAAVFCRSMVQTESVNSKIIDYFEDRGYMQWLLSKRGQPRDSKIKGDSPSGGKNMFLNEVIGLIDSITNTPLSHGDVYHLENFWFPELLEDLLVFNEKDTHANDLSMAFGQALMGAVKLMYKKIRQPSDITEGVLESLLW